MPNGGLKVALQLLEAERSPVVTAVKLPANVAYKALAQGAEQLD